MRLEKAGKTVEELRRLMAEARAEDVEWRRGRTSSLVYFAGEDVLAVAKEAYTAFFSENALGLKAFPSLRQFEAEVVAMVGGLLHGDAVAGNVTSGGTESILLAVKTARDRAKAERPSIVAPEIVMPLSAHPAFNKAAHYFGLTPVRTPLRADFRADVDALARAVTERTVLVVGSAPAFPHGVVDPIPELADIARARGIPMHVDACVGGFVLPFIEKLGRPVAPFDFRVPGVVSMSADVHKYGFGAKGASTIVYRDQEAYRHQAFEFDGWPRGRYTSPTLLGTRPGGAVAAAWAVMQYLGEDGYVRLVERMLHVKDRLVAGVTRIAGLQIWGAPDMTLFAYGTHDFDISAVADGLAERGWQVNRISEPPGIHLVVTPSHEAAVDDYLADLERVASDVAARGVKGRGAPVRYA